MNTLLAPPAAQPAAPVRPLPTPLNAATGPTPRQFLAGCARILLVPLAGVAVLLTGWTLITPVVATGWPTAVAAAAGWSLTVAAWLRHRGWPAATTHLTAWAGPAGLLAPLAPLGWLSPTGLILWGPATTLLAIALATVCIPELVCRPTRMRRRTR